MIGDARMGFLRRIVSVKFGKPVLVNLWLVLSLFLTSGCGVKLVYNNADRLARWWVSDYIEMNQIQREFFDASAADIMYWHRTSQLPIYESSLLRLADTLETTDLDLDQLKAVADEVEGWGVAFNAHAVPVAVNILLSLSTDQLSEFDKALARSNREYEREARRNPVARAEEEAKDYAGFFRRFVGRISPKQQALIVEQHLRMVPDAQVILDYRLAWQRKLLSALLANPRNVQLLEDLMTNFDDHYTPEFAEMIEANEVIYQDLTLRLLASLSPAQRARLVQELRDYATLFSELASEAPSIAPEKPQPLSN